LTFESIRVEAGQRFGYKKPEDTLALARELRPDEISAEIRDLINKAFDLPAN
jgi:hypothetical protein